MSEAYYPCVDWKKIVFFFGLLAFLLLVGFFSFSVQESLAEKPTSSHPPKEDVKAKILDVNFPSSIKADDYADIEITVKNTGKSNAVYSVGAYISSKGSYNNFKNISIPSKDSKTFTIPVKVWANAPKGLYRIVVAVWYPTYTTSKISPVKLDRKRIEDAISIRSSEVNYEEISFETEWQEEIRPQKPQFVITVQNNGDREFTITKVVLDDTRVWNGEFTVASHEKTKLKIQDISKATKKADLNVLNKVYIKNAAINPAYFHNIEMREVRGNPTLEVVLEEKTDRPNILRKVLENVLEEFEISHTNISVSKNRIATVTILDFDEFVDKGILEFLEKPLGQAGLKPDRAEIDQELRGYDTTDYEDNRTHVYSEITLLIPSKTGKRITKADIVENYREVLYFGLRDFDKLKSYANTLNNIAKDILGKSSPIEIAGEISGVSTEWAEITEDTIASFSMLTRAEAQVELGFLSNETSMAVMYEGVDQDTADIYDALEKWCELLSEEQQGKAKTYAQYEVSRRLFKATEFFHSKLLEGKSMRYYLNTCRQIEELLPQNKNWYEVNDSDGDGLSDSYEEKIETKKDDNDSDGDGTIDSLDSRPMGSESLDIFSVWSPADLLVRNSEGKMVGTFYEDDNTAKKINNLQNAVYSGPEAHHEFVIIRNPISENYKIFLTGTGSGNLDLSCSVFTSNIKGIFLYENVTFLKSSKANLTLDRKSIPQNNYKPTLEVDADGDGSPEKQVSPQVALLSKAGAEKTEIPLIWVAVGVVIIIGVVVAILAKR